MAEPNFANRTIWTHNNLEVMRGMNSNCIDLIYLDPPFNSKANYAAPIGSKAAGAEFKDTWTLKDIDTEWIDLMHMHPAMQRVLMAAMTPSDKSYLIYMAVRILEMHRILKETGSIYLHCDPTMSHYLKLLMDAIFGRSNFRNEIVWCYSVPGNARRHFPRKHDNLMFYAKDPGKARFNYDAVRVPYAKATLQRSKYAGQGFGEQTARNLAECDKGKIVEDYWTDIPFAVKSERTGYPTQKPLKLLERIIAASSNKGDMVFDPFCGCATTMVAAEILGRKWAGVDISPMGVRQVKERLADQALETGAKILGQGKITVGKVITLKTPPQRTDLGKLLRYNHPSLKKKMYGEQEGNCNGCGIHYDMKVMDVDHIVARGNGGTDHPDNLQLLCSGCNRKKGDRDMAWLKTQMSVDV